MTLLRSYSKLLLISEPILYRRIIRNKYSFSSISNNVVPIINSSNEVNFVKNKFNELVLWYEEITGMDEVRIMQNKVIEAQDTFVLAQDKRREMATQLNKIQNKLKEIYSELETTSRGEERYLQLITQEHSILKEERNLNSEFLLVERQERDSFATLSSCVKESHEKERAQAERTKYWSIIGSIIGTVIGIFGSSINNEFKMKELRKLVHDLAIRDSSKAPDENISTLLSNHEQQLTTSISEIKNTIYSYFNEKEGKDVTGNLEKLLHTINNHHIQPDNNDRAVKVLENQVEELKGILHSVQRYDGQLVAIPNELEVLIQKQSQETRLLLIGVTAIGVIVPLIGAFLQR